jgi:DNA-binding transcriptional MerR regulator
MIDALSCLSATGMSIDDMRSYLVHSKRGKAAAQDEIALLRAQAGRLEAESQYLELRKRYVALKIQYWQALEAGDESRVETIRGHARQLAQELKFPKE